MPAASTATCWRILLPLRGRAALKQSLDGNFALRRQLKPKAALRKAAKLTQRARKVRGFPARKMAMIQTRAQSFILGSRGCAKAVLQTPTKQTVGTRKRSALSILHVQLGSTYQKTQRLPPENACRAQTTLTRPKASTANFLANPSLRARLGTAWLVSQTKPKALASNAKQTNSKWRSPDGNSSGMGSAKTPRAKPRRTRGSTAATSKKRGKSAATLHLQIQMSLAGNATAATHGIATASCSRKTPSRKPWFRA